MFDRTFGFGYLHSNNWGTVLSIFTIIAAQLEEQFAIFCRFFSREDRPFTLPIIKEKTIIKLDGCVEYYSALYNV